MTLARNASIWRSFSGGADRARRVHEPPARPHGGRARVEDPSLQRAQLARPAPGSCASARRGATGASRGPSTAGRPARGRSRCRDPARAASPDHDAHARGAEARGVRAQVAPPAADRARPPRPRPRPPSAPRGGWSSRPGRRTGRAPARRAADRPRARPSSIRATGASARRARTAAEPCRSYGSSSTMPSGRCGAARAATPCRGQLGEHLVTGRAQRVHPRRALGRLVVGPHQVHRVARPELLPPDLRDPLRVRVAQRGLRGRGVAEAVHQRPPLPRRPAQHRVHEPVAATARRLGEVHRLRRPPRDRRRRP